jgi:hypothetical protein
VREIRWATPLRLPPIHYNALPPLPVGGANFRRRERCRLNSKGGVISCPFSAPYGTRLELHVPANILVDLYFRESARAGLDPYRIRVARLVVLRASPRPVGDVPLAVEIVEAVVAY